jgi:hypothetical protein
MQNSSTYKFKKFQKNAHPQGKREKAILREQMEKENGKLLEQEAKRRGEEQKRRHVQMGRWEDEEREWVSEAREREIEVRITSESLLNYYMEYKFTILKIQEQDSENIKYLLSLDDIINQNL